MLKILPGCALTNIPKDILILHIYDESPWLYIFQFEIFVSDANKQKKPALYSTGLP
jgi:hypothetical protein